MRSAALALLLAAPAVAINLEAPGECPKGSHREMTDDPYQPLKCVKDGPKAARLSEVAGPQGFKFRPRCPKGTVPAPTAGGLQPYRCVPAKAAEGAPELAPLTPGKGPLVEDDARDAEPASRPRSPRSPGAYRRYTVPGELSLEYPESFSPTDAWKEEPPMLSFTLDDGSPGKLITLSVTRAQPGQAGFVPLEEAIAKDKEWQGGSDAGTATLAGRKARVTLVAGEAKTAYLPLGADAYYVLSYSAPVDKFAAFLPAFDRLLSSLKLTARGR